MHLIFTFKYYMRDAIHFGLISNKKTQFRTTNYNEMHELCGVMNLFTLGLFNIYNPTVQG